MKVTEEQYNDDYSRIAFNWAPILYQHINLEKPLRDILCAIDYDGDWNTSNNRKHLYTDDYDLIPVVYYSIAETLTHYYILYCFYHADDLTHENDLEGCLVITDKQRSLLLGMITIAHFDFYSYVYKNRLKGGKKRATGKLYAESLSDGFEHPMVTQEVNKHGCYAWKGVPFWIRLLPWWWPLWTKCDSHKLRVRSLSRYFSRQRRDSIKCCKGIRYYPSNRAIMPDIKKINSFLDTEYGYVLVDILGPKGFWDKRDNPETFNENYESRGVFNSSTPGSANAPWVWDDSIWDEIPPTGTIFRDPVNIARKYFHANFSEIYIKKMDENNLESNMI